MTLPDVEENNMTTPSDKAMQLAKQFRFEVDATIFEVATIIDTALAEARAEGRLEGLKQAAKEREGWMLDFAGGSAYSRVNPDGTITWVPRSEVHVDPATPTQEAK